MKIFSWMRSKLNGKDNNKPFQESTSHHTVQESCKEEFSDWPNALLAIGTLGNTNNNLKDSDSTTAGSSSQEQQYLENEEFDKELRLLLNKHISLDSSVNNNSNNNNNNNFSSIEKLLDCLPEENKDSSDGAAHLQRTTSVVNRGGRDIHFDPKKKGIINGKKSLSFLIKKAFLCGSGFVPSPILRDSLIPEAKLEKSRMEKILRAMLHKKIYPHRPGPMAASKKYLDIQESDSDDEEHEGAASEGSKWVKTDSEYIVLEI